MRGLQYGFDLEKKEDEIGLLEKETQIQQLKEKKQQSIIYASVIAIFLIFLLALGLYRRYNFIKETNRIIEEEKNRSDNLLYNILPEETALELKLNGKVQAKKFDSVTVLFTDFKGFTHFARDLSPEELVNSVDFYFSKFDQIMRKYGMEKIKTIGDAYMCAGGLPFPTTDHPFKMILAAFEIVEFIEESKKNVEDDITNFDIRIGINTGPIVAGVVGIHKFAYDIWGDTVNVASRMETLSNPGRINISENTYELVKDVFQCKYRGEIEVKNRGMMKMYFVNGIKDQTFLDQLEFQKTVV
jgi:adenylate cyclase